MALSTLTDQSLWIPNLERLLEDELALGLNIFIKTWENEGDIDMKVLLKKNILPDLLRVVISQQVSSVQIIITSSVC